MVFNWEMRNIIVKISSSKNEIMFNFEMEDDDRHNPTDNFSFGKRYASIKTNNYDLKEVHNDLLALSIILMCNPFVGKRLKLPFKISKRFEDSVKNVLTRYSIEAEGSYIPHREINTRYRPALAFSGGVDSTAALAVMPANTAPIFMDRPVSKGSLYNPAAAHNSCKILNEIGFDAERVECDLEYLRDPVGFPTDVANAVPCIILADKMGLASVSFGTVLESAYGIGHNNFREYMRGSHWIFFSKLFKGAGIPMALPIAGISEVGTSIIANKSPVGIVAQSCIRGEWGAPCNKCWKCFRKGLLNVALKQTNLKEEEVEIFFKSGEIKNKLSSYPISHENVLSFSVNRIDCDFKNQNLENLSRRVEGLGELNFLNKWYPKSIELIPVEWRYECREKILKYLLPMKKIEQEMIEEWSMEDYLLSEDTIMANKRMIGNWT
jgi:hypothetical protein